MINGGQPTSRVSNFFGLPRSHMIADDTSLLRDAPQGKGKTRSRNLCLRWTWTCRFSFFLKLEKKTHLGMQRSWDRRHAIIYICDNSHVYDDWEGTKGGIGKNESLPKNLWIFPPEAFLKSSQMCCIFAIWVIQPNPTDRKIQHTRSISIWRIHTRQRQNSSTYRTYRAFAN